MNLESKKCSKKNAKDKMENTGFAVNNIIYIIPYNVILYECKFYICMKLY